MVDRIKALCRAQNTSVTKLEAALGFGNGTIGKWRNAKSAPPADRLQMVADALGVTSDYLLNGDNEKKPAEKGELTPYMVEVLELFKDADEENQKKLLELVRNGHNLMGGTKNG